MRAILFMTLTVAFACQSAEAVEDDGGQPAEDQGRACTVEAPGDATYADQAEAFVEACACFYEQLFAHGPERGCQLVGIMAAESIVGMPDPDDIREQGCSMAYEDCVTNPRWVTPEGRTEICEYLFDLAAPCGMTLEERQGCHGQLVTFEATHHERLACEWPQLGPLPCGLTYGGC